MLAKAMAGTKPRPHNCSVAPSGGKHRQYSLVGLLGRGAGGLLLLCPAEAGVAGAVVFGTVWVLLDPGLWAGAEAGLVGDVRFSAVFASAVD